MDTNKYKVIITPTAFKEINRIYDYLLTDLYAETATEDLMKLVETEVQNLKQSPRIHTEIEKFDELDRRYRRIVLKKYIILYTIDEENSIVYVAHMYHGTRNYLDDLSL